MGGGGASGGLGLMSGRTTANLLTRTTAILAGSFMATSILLAILSGGAQRGSVLERAPELAPITLPIPVPGGGGFGGPAPVVPGPATQAPTQAPIVAPAQAPGANTPQGPVGFQPAPQQPPAPAQNPFPPQPFPNPGAPPVPIAP
jgi:preprotein translocase subunit SecG